MTRTIAFDILLVKLPRDAPSEGAWPCDCGVAYRPWHDWHDCGTIARSWPSVIDELGGANVRYLSDPGNCEAFGAYLGHIPNCSVDHLSHCRAALRPQLQWRSLRAADTAAGAATPEPRDSRVVLVGKVGDWRESAWERTETAPIPATVHSLAIYDAEKKSGAIFIWLHTSGAFV